MHLRGVCIYLSTQSVLRSYVLHWYYRHTLFYPCILFYRSLYIHSGKSTALTRPSPASPPSLLAPSPPSSRAAQPPPTPKPRVADAPTALRPPTPPNANAHLTCAAAPHAPPARHWPPGTAACGPVGCASAPTRLATGGNGESPRRGKWRPDATPISTYHL